MILTIHRGHNNYVTGAAKYLNEVAEANKVKNEVIRLLKAHGDIVYDCTDDAGKTQNANLSNIVKKCNKHKVDLNLSIHLNAGGGTGVECLIYPRSSSKDEATRICAKVSSALGIKNRGVKSSRMLYVLRKTSAPTVLVECCFVDSTTDRDKWDAKKCAKAIVEGILNKTISDSTTSNSKPSTPSKPSAPSKNDKYDSWVADLQKELNKQYKAGLAVDGLDGPKTLAACPTIKKGAKGNITKLVQKRLKSVGFSITADGIFGSDTYNAIKVFQKNRKLSQDGIIGKNTWKFLLSGKKY